MPVGKLEINPCLPVGLRIGFLANIWGPVISTFPSLIVFIVALQSLENTCMQQKRLYGNRSTQMKKL
jgi:hypothetical protein